MESSLSNTPAVILAVALAAAVLANTGADLRRLLTGRNVVLIAIGSWFLLEAVTVPAELAAEYDQDEYAAGVFAVGLAAAGFLLGYHRTTGCNVFPRLGRMVRGLDDPGALGTVVLLGSVVGFAPILYFGGTDLIDQFHTLLQFRKDWGSLLGCGRYGDARAALLMLEMFVTGVGPFAAVLLLDRRTSFLRQLLCAVVLVWPILRAYGSGTRSAMITSVIPVFGVLYFKTPPRVQRWLILVALLLTPLVYQFMAAMVISRGQGEFSWEAADKANYVGNEMFRELLFIRRKVPADLGYQYGYGYYVQLVNPIPRFLWPGKPTADAGLLMASLYGDVDAKSGEATLTISPGLIGEMYMNFGWLGVIGLSAFGGWLVRGWDRIAEQNADSLVVRVYHVAGLAVLYIMGRSFTMNMFYGLLSFAALAWLVTVVRRPAGPAA